MDPLQRGRSWVVVIVRRSLTNQASGRKKIIVKGISTEILRLDYIHLHRFVAYFNSIRGYP